MARLSSGAGVLLTAVGCLAGGAACTAPTPATGGASASSTREASAGPSAAEGVAASSSPTFTSCVGQVGLVASSGRRVTVSAPTGARLRVPLGAVLHVTATGQCGDDIGATLQTGGLLSQRGAGLAQVFQTVRPGTVLLVFAHAGCDEISPRPEGCVGGVAYDGSVTVVIAPR